MAYFVTARKWRPQKFEEVVGQEHITKTLKNAIQNNRIANAFIFSGPRGVGKTTTARILAKALNCLNPKDGEPCNECDLCVKFLKSQTLDIIEIDGASNRRIEEIRKLRESVKYAPTVGKYKVYIIDEVHMLTTESFNALLKTLEEPPAHTVFIFATTDVHKVPLTILSRCQRFDFRRIELQAIKKQLKKIADAENIEIDDQSLTIIAKKADGALRDAQSLFDQVVSYCGNKIEVKDITLMLNLIDEEIYFALSDAILEKNFAAAFDISQKLYENGWDFIDFTNGILEHFRNIMTLKIRGNTDLIETSENYKKRYFKYKDLFSEGDLLRILTYLSKLQSEIKIIRNQKLKIEIALTQIIGLEKSSTISELLEKISSGTIEVKSNVTNPSDELKKKALNNSIAEPDNKYTSRENGINSKANDKKDVLSTNLSSIKSKWEDFLQVVNNEKKLSLGPLLSNSIPLKLDGNILTISISNIDDAKIIKENCDYLKKKSKEFFSRALQFSFETIQNNSNDKIIEKDGIASENELNNNIKQNSEKEIPLIKAVINKLGGLEIKR